MKKIFLPVILCVAMAMSANAQEIGNDNIYATGLKVIEDGAKIEFVLNAPGNATINFYKEGVKVHSIEKTGLEKGVNTISLTGVFPDAVKTNDKLTCRIIIHDNVIRCIKT